MWNAEMRVQGRSDSCLTAQGHIQSLILLKQLRGRPLSAIYASTLQRSIQTAQPLSQHLNLPIRKRTELDELAFGILEGKQLFHLDEREREEWERFRANRFTYRIPGAENYTDVAQRLRPFEEAILQEHRGEEILIVGHRGVNRMLIGLLLEIQLEEAVKIEQTNDCVYLIQRNGETTIFHMIDGESGQGLLFEGQRMVL
jgi:broad specificity phosphatase PhoE